METQFSILSTAILLMFILDPFGNIPILLAILKNVPTRRRYIIIVRELVIGLIILMFFLFFGNGFLNLFHLDTEAVSIAGGVIFFIIGLKLIFPSNKGEMLFAADEEPLIVPIALPMIAGPSALATLLVMANANPENMSSLTISLLLAWGMTAVLLLSSPFLYKILGQKGLTAMEKLMGMLLLIMAVQMFINGIRGFVTSL